MDPSAKRQLGSSPRALDVFEARAHFDATQMDVHIRVAGHDGKLYLDLGDEDWRAVEIDATGWRVIDKPPVRFRRTAGMQPLPAPVRGGSIEALRSFLNVTCDSDFVLIVAWALAVLRDKGPYPVLVLSGEQGSAKSTFSAILRALLPHQTAAGGPTIVIVGSIVRQPLPRAGGSASPLPCPSLRICAATFRRRASMYGLN